MRSFLRIDREDCPLNRREFISILLSQLFGQRLYGMRHCFRRSVQQTNLLYIQLIQEQIRICFDSPPLERVTYGERGLCERLADLTICLLPRRMSQRDKTYDQSHIPVKRFVNHFRQDLRPIGEMHRFRCGLIHSADKILVQLLSKEWHGGREQLCNRDKSRIKGGI